MHIYLGADHRGFYLKEVIKGWLSSQGIKCTDSGPNEYVEQDDYVDYAVAVANAVINEEKSLGIVLCGSGAGVSIAANKVKGVRCGIGLAPKQVVAMRKDDNLTVLALAADFITQKESMKMVEAFITTPFIPSINHTRRLAKLQKVEHYV